MSASPPNDDLPPPFDSDHALRVVGRIAIESARLEFYLAILRSLIDDSDTRLAAQLVVLPNDDNALAIRQAARARAWELPTYFRPEAIEDCTSAAVAVLKERGNMMHSPWFTNKRGDGTDVVVALHSRNVSSRPVSVSALEDLSRRIDEACEQVSASMDYVHAENRRRKRPQP